MFAMADAISRLGRVIVPATEPKTTYSASVTGGGTSINSIPNAVWTEFDLRSESVRELTDLEERFLEIVDAAVAAENDVRSTRNGPNDGGDHCRSATGPRAIPANRTNWSKIRQAAIGGQRDSRPASTPPPPTPTSQ
jgi:acetylornithine deacetylase/succinyl-diaminopimelate desuccinylase-like protein